MVLFVPKLEQNTKCLFFNGSHVSFRDSDCCRLLWNSLDIELFDRSKNRVIETVILSFEK